MKPQETPSSPPIGLGVTLILTVLLVLTLSLFAALTLSTARSDLALSQINAQTVEGYYRADSQAVEHYHAFSLGEDDTLEADIPINDTQALRIRFSRDEAGQPRIDLWETVSLQPQTQEENTWNLWDGGAD